MTTKRNMVFDIPKGTGGCRLGVYIDGVYKEHHEPWVEDKEAAKDYVFRMNKYEYSPIDDTEVTVDDMKDTAKIRRFKYYGPHNLETIVQFCTIVDGEIQIDENAFVEHYNIGGLNEYLLSHYLEDIQKSMKERKVQPIVIKTPPQSNSTTSSSQAILNHSSTNGTTYQQQPNPVIPPHYIPDDAGFDANNGFMVNVGDNTFKPNFASLVGADADNPLVTEKDIVDYELYVKDYLKNAIQFAVTDMVKDANPAFKDYMTNENVMKVMNQLFDDILSGTPEEVNNRISNQETLISFITKGVTNLFNEIVFNQNSSTQNETNAEVVINQPEEPNILGDTPVDNTAIKKEYPILSNLEKIISYNGAYGVKFEKDEYGLIKAAVFATSGTYDEAIESKSFTMDLNQLIFNKDDKFWPGIEHTERPDFKKCYALTPEAIVKLRDGKELGEPLFGGSLPKLNKYVDIRTLFSLVDDNIDADLAQKVLLETKKVIMPGDRVGKRFSKNRGIYTEAIKTNETTFEFKIVFGDEYPRYVGGDSIKNTGGTGDLVVKVSTSEDNKTTVTK